MLILITDGQQTYVPNIVPPQEYANNLKADGVEIYSIGIGTEIDRNELESYQSKPEYIFLASDLDALVGVLVSEIGQALICEGKIFYSLA